MEASDGRCIVAMKVLHLCVGAEAPGIESLEPDEEASQAAADRLLEERGAKNRLNGPRGLPKAAHPAHSLEQGARKPHVPEEMVVEEIQVAPGKTFDLGEGGVHPLRVEAAS